MRGWLRATIAIIGASAVVGCVDEPPNVKAMMLGAPPLSAVNLRAIETRRYDTNNLNTVLATTTQTLQDLGFLISESSSELGVIVGNKQRDAEEAGQMAAQIAMIVLVPIFLKPFVPDRDRTQTITVTVVAIPVEKSKQIEVRASFDRKLYKKNGNVSGEFLSDPDLYKQFFSKLSSGMFLEGHEI